MRSARAERDQIDARRSRQGPRRSHARAGSPGPACRTRGLGRRDVLPSSPACAAPALAGASALAARGRLSRCRCEPPCWLTIVAGPACAPRCWLQSPPASCSLSLAWCAIRASVRVTAGSRSLPFWRSCWPTAWPRSRSREAGRRPPQPRGAAASRAALRSAAAGCLSSFPSPRRSSSCPWLSRSSRRSLSRRSRGTRATTPGWGGRRRSGAGWSAACSCSSSTSRSRMPATVVRTTPRLCGTSTRAARAIS